MTEQHIRPATEADFEAIWAIFQALIQTGDTYSFDAATSRETCHAYWFGSGVQSFVAVSAAPDAPLVLGMYKLIPNQPGHGAHVANASFMVAAAAQGRGLGLLMGRHCLAQARRCAYLALQFNFVVSSNTGALALWQKLGFAIVGTLPSAYRHARLGYLDAYVMYQLLSDPAGWPLTGDTV